MPKTFEDEFMEAQADMVSICLEYVEDDAEKIYIQMLPVKIELLPVITFIKSTGKFGSGII